MSRSEARIAALAVACGWTLAAASPPAVAQDVGNTAAPGAVQQGPPDPSKQVGQSREAMEQARQAYSIPSRTRPGRCRQGASDEIVVCAPDDGADQRVPSTATSDPNSREAQRALNDGVPHVDLRPRYPGPVVARGCFIPPCPPAPAYLIDVTKLPPPPAGSDAEKIAKGDKRAD